MSFPEKELGACLFEIHSEKLKQWLGNSGKQIWYNVELLLAWTAEALVSHA